MLTTSESLHARALPRGCTFSESDWRVLAPFWYPVAFSHEITGRPHAVTLLDERVVVYRLSDGSLSAARDICHHRGVPLSLGHVEGNETATGFVADYISTVSNYSHESKHLSPPGFLWRRRFEVFLPFIAKLTVFFPGEGQLHIMNAASPASARKTRLFVPICRNFDKDAPLQATLDFNYQVFAEDLAIVERQFPEDLPIDLQDEAHFPADRGSIAYRRGLAEIGLGRSYTA